MELKLVLVTVKKNQVSPVVERKIKEAFECTFCKHFSLSEDVRFDICDGDGKDIDFAITYDFIPVIPNAAKKLNNLVEDMGKELLEIFQGKLKYNGKGRFIPLSNAKIIGTPSGDTRVAALDNNGQNEFKALAKQYIAENPKFKFSQIVLDDDVMREINEALVVLTHREMLFDEWGLKSIMSPSVILNLYGKSGTGKTMAAEAIADRMGKNIIKATYADIESKWHGEGPQKLKAIFMAATDQDAVLFIDESDSMLSSRLGNVSNGSEQAINSMRSQLLICLENFDGVVIFATNLIENYDPAFLTRLICVEMKQPDQNARLQIWKNHLYGNEDTEIKLNIPIENGLNLDELAEKYDFVGRDIRNAVKKACISSVVSGRNQVNQSDLLYACEAIKKQNAEIEAIKNQTIVKPLTDEQKQKVTKQVAEAIVKKAEDNKASQSE